MPIDQNAAFGKYRAQQAKASMRAKVLSGLPSGKPPLGYSFNGKGRLLRDEETAKHIEHAFILVGTFGFSLRKTLRAVTRAGLTARTGKPLHLSSLHSMLTNPFYMGTIRFGKELYLGGYEPTVTGALFANAATNLKKHRTR